MSFSRDDSRRENPAEETLALDKRYVWHPFTQMREWTGAEYEPTVIVRGAGALLFDAEGREYLDGNASIWTNIHGHNHPKINAAIVAQLGRIAHCSFLGLTNEPAPRLAKELVERLNPDSGARVFFSDDGATAIEAGIKMICQARAQRGETKRKTFISLGEGYHGDTVGAMSVGHVPVFHSVFRDLMQPAREAPMPDCYRCPYNQAAPERGVTSRQSRVCQFECARDLEAVLDEESETGTALVMEPRVQGVAGFVFHPEGYLRRAAELCKSRGIWLLLDEVMTGFGRTGTLFACQKEGVIPDVIALAKGLTGGYLPLAATVASAEIYDAFLGEFAERRAFFHGHSYTANPLGCAAALASLELFSEEKTLERVARLEKSFASGLNRFWKHPNVGDVRCEGLIGAIELVSDFGNRTPFPYEERMGARVCEAAKRHGLLTRPVGNVLVLMPALCVTEEQMAAMIEALWRGLCDTLPASELVERS